MCDFHSIAVRFDGEIAHVAENSHSTAVQRAGWRENGPNKKPVFVEAEWGGLGEYPGAAKICRVPAGEELTPAQIKAIDGHYTALAARLAGKEVSKLYALRFASPEYADVAANEIISAHPEIPKQVGCLLLRLFTGLLEHDRDKGLVLPVRFLAAIPAKSDLSLVWPKFALWLLTDEAHGVIRFAKTESPRAAILGVAALCQRWAAGDKPATSEWQSARRIASAAAYVSAAAYAAASAADIPAAAAEATALAAAADIPAAYARKKQYSAMAEKLIEIIANSPAK